MNISHALLSGMATLPESPRWLLLNGRSTAEAGNVLRRVQGKLLGSDDAIEVCACVFVHTCVCMLVCVCVCLRVPVHMCVFVCMCVYNVLW